jgi:hypothetical protein
MLLASFSEGGRVAHRNRNEDTTMTKRQALTQILKAADVLAEDGSRMIDFQNRNHDRADFATVSRQQLLRMLEAAFTAGMEADCPN